FTSSPLAAAISAGIAAGIWYLREHPEFLGPVAEAQLQRAVLKAISVAVQHGWLELIGEANYAAARDATYDATGAATAAATADVTAAATAAATRAATAAATADATAAATADATRDATGAATRAATGAAICDATAAAVYRFLLACVVRSYRIRQGGNLWSNWDALLTFFRYVAQLPLDY